MYGLLGWLWWKFPAACHCVRTEACKRLPSTFSWTVYLSFMSPAVCYSTRNKKKWCSYESGLRDTCIFLDVISNLFCLWYSWWLFIYLVCVCVWVRACTQVLGKSFPHFPNELFVVFFFLTLNIYLVLEVTMVISWLHIENFCYNCDLTFTMYCVDNKKKGCICMCWQNTWSIPSNGNCVCIRQELRCWSQQYNVSFLLE